MEDQLEVPIFNTGDVLIMRALELGVDIEPWQMKVISDYYLDR